MTSSSLSRASVCFVGGGSMAEAIVRGLIDRGVVPPERIALINKADPERPAFLRRTYGVRATNDPAEKSALVAGADILVLAMKPKDAAGALAEIRGAVRRDALIVSVIAGMSIRAIRTLLGADNPIARTMPNTSSHIGLGATGVSYSEGVREAQREMARAIFSSVGIVKEVPEEQLDMITGISGSGPAYFYYIIEALIAAGVEGGLDADTARDLAVQTALGAASMIKATGEDPAELRRKVTSPNGTTQAALEAMADRGLRGAVIAGALRAAERARELGADIDAKLRG